MKEVSQHIASETRILALLSAQTNRMRIELAKLRNDVANAQRDLDKIFPGFRAPGSLGLIA